MKNTTRALLLSFLALATTAYGGTVPAFDVTVSNPGGKMTFKGKTNSSGTFATGDVAPGPYVVQFNSKSSELKGKQFAVVVSAGRKKVMADSVAGEKFAAGGVAMKVDVGPGMKITGQVASAAVSESKDIKVVNGKKYFWVKEVGSNSGKWVEEGTPEAGNVVRAKQDPYRTLQDSRPDYANPGGNN